MKNLLFLFILTAWLSQLHAQNRVQEAWVRHYGSGLLPGYDRATAIAVDKLGNIYVTGESVNAPYGIDYLTIKYDASGSVVWLARYDGHSNDLPAAIAVDSAGNVYVTGKSLVADSGYYYATVKYSSEGIEQWVALYSGTGISDLEATHEATALAVDDSGNVYVTGKSWGGRPGTLTDYATIKYNSNGVEKWVARYDGLKHEFDEATALTVDNSGNVYVTGRSFSSGAGADYTDYDYTTIKYNSAGIAQWVVRYNGPNTNNPRDEAKAIAVDGSRNVYVTGRSVGLGTSWDYTTIKYSPLGVEQWVARYNGPDSSNDIVAALAIDDSGNVYVTGISEGINTYSDYATVKYNTDGVEQWAARYNGPANGGDEATDIGVDISGNVYVTGRSWGGNPGTSSDYATIKYNSAGVEKWVVRYNGSKNSVDEATAIAVDGIGNVIVTGSSIESGIGPADQDVATIKYNSNGIQQWIVQYDGPGNSVDEAATLTVDKLGNVYVTGTSYGFSTRADYATVKYNNAGIQEWIARYNGPRNTNDFANAIAIDASGNIYVTGSSSDSGATSDYLTVKYNSAGIEQWVARYNGPSNTYDVAVDIAVDNLGNIYVTGSSGAYYATLKYNSVGKEQWAARFPGATTALAIDDSGNVYVTGNYTTIKYNTAGREQWIARYNGQATAIAVDYFDYVYVTGHSYSAPGDYMTVKYNQNGVEQWAVNYEGPGNRDDNATDIAVDGLGNVYVTGASGPDFATVKYNNTGVQQWVDHYSLPADPSYGASALELDATGNIYVTGGTGGDFVTIKYNSAGVKQWVARNRGPGGSIDRAVSISVDNTGNVYVTGTSENLNSRVYTTIKYVQTTVSVEEKGQNQPTTYRLAQNYPNPFNPSTTIRYALAKPGQVTLKVFNLEGQEIVTLVSENKLAGEYEIQWNPTNVPSGVYLYRLQAGEFTETKKIVLLR